MKIIKDIEPSYTHNPKRKYPFRRATTAVQNVADTHYIYLPIAVEQVGESASLTSETIRKGATGVKTSTE